MNTVYWRKPSVRYSLHMKGRCSKKFQWRSIQRVNLCKRKTSPKEKQTVWGHAKTSAVNVRANNCCAKQHVSVEWKVSEDRREFSAGETGFHVLWPFMFVGKAIRSRKRLSWKDMHCSCTQSYTNKRVLCLMDILIHNFIKSFKRLRLNTLRKNFFFKHLFLNVTQLQPTELAYIIIVSKYSLEVGCPSSTSILRVDPQKYPNI